MNPGAALVKLRWDKATDEQKVAEGKRLAKARWGKRRASGKRQRAKGKA